MSAAQHAGPSVAPGSSCLPEGIEVFERGWLSANNILLTGGSKRVLIDSGYCTHSDQTLGLVTAALEGQALDLLVNTHLHSDHCGGNAALQAQYPQLQTLIPPGHASEVANWDAVALTYIPTGQQCQRFRYDNVLVPGQVMRWGATHWEVHAAGGHDPHSVIFFEPDHRILISADSLWENGFGVIFPELDGVDAFDDARRTLDLIETLEPLIVIPGHGAVFAYAPEVMVRARQKLQRFQENPRKHAQHAIKVFLKFKLLEVQRRPAHQFLDWAENTPYSERIWRLLEVEQPLRVWLESMVEELVGAGVARRIGTDIVNA